MRKGMSAVHDCLYASGAREATDIAHREDLTGQVRDMAEVDHLRPRGDRTLKPVDEILHAGRRRREWDLSEHQSFTPRALVPCGEHATVILVGGQDLVTSLEIEAELCDFQGLTGIAGDGHFFGITSERPGQPLPYALHLRLEDLPHRVDRRLVGKLQVTS